MTSSAEPEVCVVTGAFGYSGKYITQQLLDTGRRVRTLTNSPNRPHPFGNRIEVRPLAFDDPASLVESMRGADVFCNTYWVRFSSSDPDYTQVVRNSLRLFQAARDAGVRRVVHISIANPSADSPFAYFRGKAAIEKALMESGLSYAILRPTILFGREDILVNNIAWTLRKMPVFGIFGDGSYRIQPVHVEDLATLAVEQGGSFDNRVINAVGPETFVYKDMVRTIGHIIGKPRPLMPVPAFFGYWTTRLVGKLVGDVLMTRDEMRALMAGLLCTDSPPAGSTKLTEWAARNADSLGRRYASELARRKNRGQSYDRL